MIGSKLTRRTVFLLLFLLLMPVTGCCAKLKPHEQGLLSSKECLLIYKNLDVEFHRQYDTLSGKQDYLMTKAQVWREACKSACLAFSDATTEWSRTGEKPENWESMKAQTKESLYQFQLAIGPKIIEEAYW